MKRFDLLRALRALRALHQNPTDSSQVFHIVDALPGFAYWWAARRLQRQDFGRRLLRERPLIRAVLGDRERLAAMPKGSLGEAFLHFIDEEKIVVADLEKTDKQVRGDQDNLPDSETFVWQHLRDTHDLWHVVTGYRTDLKGEPSLQSFTFAQTGIPGSGFICLMAYLSSGPELRPMMRTGLWAGLRARWFLGVDWETLLTRPLAEVREQLRIVPVPPYTTVREFAGFSR